MNIAPNTPPKAVDPHAVHRLARLSAALHRLEDMLIAGLLCATLGLALYQIVLRNFLGAGIVWADTLLRILVLWLGMAGAMAATRQSGHINIDLLTRFLPGRLRRGAARLTTSFAAGVCFVAGYYSLQFVRSEFEMGGAAFAHVPIWVCEAILPVAFWVIALRYTLQLLTQFRPQTDSAP
jgi:TRAP-type C4-dicarboxylate transport system permease small subunit